MGPARASINPAQELALGEPADGGLEFYRALDEWIEQPSEAAWAERCKRVLGDDWREILIPTFLVERELRDWKIVIFKDMWQKGLFIAFGYPLHDRLAHRRVVVSSALAARLTISVASIFGDRAGDATDAYIMTSSRSIKRRAEKETRRYRQVLFYQVYSGAPTKSHRGRKRPTAAEEMKRVLPEVLKDHCFNTRKEVHQAVLNRLGINGDAPRGYKYDNFIKQAGPQLTGAGV